MEAHWTYGLGQPGPSLELACYIWLGESVEVRNLVSKHLPRGELGFLFRVSETSPRSELLSKALSLGLPREVSHFLCIAIAQRELNIARFLISTGLPVVSYPSPSLNWCFPMFTAAQVGGEAVRLLLENGADIDEETNQPLGTDQVAAVNPSCTALGAAILRKLHEAVEVLLKFGASIHWPLVTEKELKNRQAQNGHSLTYARLLPVYRSTFVEDTADSLASTCRRSSVQVEGLYYCSEYESAVSALYAAIRVRDESLVARLIEQGAEIEYSPMKRDSCLCLALAQRDLETASLLVRKGAKIYSFLSIVRHYWPRNLPLLSLACLPVSVHSQAAPMVDFILYEGGALYHKEVTSTEGWTALHVAAQKNNVLVLEALLKRGVAPDQISERVPSALQKACSSGASEATRLLLEYGADPNRRTSESPPLIKAFKSHSVPCILHLRDHGAIVPPRREDRHRVCHYINKFLCGGNGICLAYEWLRMGGRLSSVPAFKAVFGVLDDIEDALEDSEDNDFAGELSLKSLHDRGLLELIGRTCNIVVPAFALNESCFISIISAGTHTAHISQRRSRPLKEHFTPVVFGVVIWRLRRTVDLLAHKAPQISLSVRVLAAPPIVAPSELTDGENTEQNEDVANNAFTFSANTIAVEESNAFFRETDVRKRLCFLLCAHRLAREGKGPLLGEDVLRKILLIHDHLQIAVVQESGTTKLSR